MLLDRYGDTLSPVNYECGAIGVSVLATHGLVLTRSCAGNGVYEITVRAAYPEPEAVIALTVPLNNAASFWRPGVRGSVPLAPDWHGDVSVSLANSAPLGCLLDVDDNCLLGFAFSLAVRESTLQYGVDEEHGLFVIFLRFRMNVDDQERLLVVDAAATLTLIDAGRRLARFVRGDRELMPIPVSACEPVFSTWYARLQDIDAEYLLDEADGMVSLGCRSVFVDDGWQEQAHGRGYAGCGDWVADPAKFPDLRATIRKLHGKGLAVVLWIAPLLVGERSRTWHDVAAQDPIYLPGKDLDVHVLDPRRAVNRARLAATCRRLMDDYGVDGLKIDFLDQASRYQGTPAPHTDTGDLNDVGEAMLALLDEIRGTMYEGRVESPIVEFRSPYVNPVLGSYANVLRASDCPSDAIANRCGVMDARIVADGRIVDSDMMLWNIAAQPAACAQQIMSAFFGVPQLSVSPSLIPSLQRNVCVRLLNLWKDCRRAILGGQLTAGSQALSYPVVNAVGDDMQVTGVYTQNVVVDVDAQIVHRLVLLNATDSCVSTVRVHGLDYGRSLHMVSSDAAGSRERQTVIDVTSGTMLVDVLVEPFGVLDVTW